MVGLGALLSIEPTLFSARPPVREGGVSRGTRRTATRDGRSPSTEVPRGPQEAGSMPYYRCPACGLTGYTAAGYSTASVCPTCSAALPQDSRVYVAPGAKHDVRCRLPARPKAVAEARRALVGLALPRQTRDDLALVVSELVTNSIRHAGLSANDEIGLHVKNGDARVRVAVHDGGHGFTPPEPASDPLAVGGQGLPIVARLSEAWGVLSDRPREGCTVWCEIAVDETRADAGARGVTTGYIPPLAIEMARAATPAPAGVPHAFATSPADAAAMTTGQPDV